MLAPVVLVSAVRIFPLIQNYSCLPSMSPRFQGKGLHLSVLLGTGHPISVSGLPRVMPSLLCYVVRSCAWQEIGTDIASLVGWELRIQTDNVYPTPSPVLMLRPSVIRSVRLVPSFSDFFPMPGTCQNVLVLSRMFQKLAACWQL